MANRDLLLSGMNEKNEKTDEEIIQLILKNPDFFGVIIQKYEKPLARYIKRLGVFGNEDVEDVLQNVFIKMYKNINSFDVNLQFSSWVYRIAHNETMSFFRAKNIRPEGHLLNDSEEILPLIQDELNLWKDQNQILNAEILNKAIFEIDQKYKDVIVLRYFENKEYSEISDILQIPEGSVATLLHRAKNKLEKKLSHIHPVK